MQAAVRSCPDDRHCLFLGRWVVAQVSAAAFELAALPGVHYFATLGDHVGARITCGDIRAERLARTAVVFVVTPRAEFSDDSHVVVALSIHITRCVRISSADVSPRQRA